MSLSLPSSLSQIYLICLMALIICEHIHTVSFEMFFGKRRGKSGGKGSDRERERRNERRNRIIIYFLGVLCGIVKNDEMCFRAVVSATLALTPLEARSGVEGGGRIKTFGG